MNRRAFIEKMAALPVVGALLSIAPSAVASQIDNRVSAVASQIDNRVFVKKPETFKAEQWWPGKQIDGVIPMYVDNPDVVVLSTEGTYQFPKAGDWIVTDMLGKRSVVKADIFTALYQPAKG